MLSKFFIERPIAAWVVSIAILLLGGVAVFTLPIAEYPDITPPTVQVSANYPGANAQVVADSVAAPIEEQVTGVEGMMYMSSQSTNDGTYNLTVTFELGTDLDMAQVLVQNRVSLAMPQLPQQVQVQGVSTKKQSPTILLVVNLISPEDRYDSIFLSNYATIYIKDELSRLSGVGNVNIFGERDYSMRVWLDPDQMATRNLATSDVVQAVQNQNVQVAAGQIGRPPVPKGQEFQYTMNTLGRLVTAEQFGEIIVKTGQGTDDQGKVTAEVVRLKDVAQVELGAQQYDQICTLDNMTSAGLAVFQLPGSNALDVAEEVKAKMDQLSKSFPQGVEYKIVYDTTPFIQESVDEVYKTLGEAILLVALVVLVFLQDWKAMILPMIDVPVALVGTFAVMALMGFSLNNLTLFGLVLAIGIVVDDAIVVLENVERQMATGLDAKAATIKAMGEITGPIVAITLVLSAVFIPGAFLPGIGGQFYRQFALTIASAMVISAINAMTLTPSRAVAIFKTEEGEHQREALPWWIFGIVSGLLAVKLGHLILGTDLLTELFVGETAESALAAHPPKWLPWAIDITYFLPGLVVGCVVGWFIIGPVNKVLGIVFGAFNRMFDKLTELYGWGVARMVRVSLLVLLLYGGLLFLTYEAFSHAPKGFLPTQDQGYLLINVQLPNAASVERTEEILQTITKVALGDPDNKEHYPGVPGTAHTVGIAGYSAMQATSGSNYGTMFVVLEPFDERLSHSKYDAVIAEELRGLFADEIDGAKIDVLRAPPIQGLGNFAGFTLQTEQRGFVNLVELQDATDELIEKANEDPRLSGVFTMYNANTPQLYLDIDRTKCKALEVEVSDVFDTLQVYMGGYYVNLFNRFGRTWQVNLLAQEQFRTHAESLAQLKVRNRLGQMVPLGTLVSIRDTGGPQMIMRYNNYTSAAVNGNPAAGYSSGEAISAMDELCNELGIPYDWTTIYYMQIQEGATGSLVFLLGGLLVFLILAFKYESWHLPLAVVLVVPMCMLCAVTGMLIAAMPIDLFVQIGLIVLVGLAAKNAILIVEFANQQYREGISLVEATRTACVMRLRPIIMTSLAFILGVVPLVLATGAGAEMRRSLGTAVFSGMIGVSFFGLMLTPVFFYVLLRGQAKRAGRLQGKPSDVPPAKTSTPPPT